jgi:alkylated DNA repair dioxygenase AlkB
MDLFGNDPASNLLPCDGVVNYHGQVLNASDSRYFYDTFLHGIPWKNDEAVIFGKHIITARKVAWYGDSNFFYAYSGTCKQALVWTTELVALKAIVEEHTGSRFNSCLLNLYHDGNEGMAWHSDDEKSLGKDSTIASVSLGAEREFRLKHKRIDEKTSVLLESGSLLVMKGNTQTHWLHCIPKSKKIKIPRINLTFRTMIPQ